MYALVDSLHTALKKTITQTGSDLPSALLEHIRANDSAVLEASEKVGIVLALFYCLCLWWLLWNCRFWWSSRKNCSLASHLQSSVMSWVSHMTYMSTHNNNYQFSWLEGFYSMHFNDCWFRGCRFVGHHWQPRCLPERAHCQCNKHWQMSS